MTIAVQISLDDTGNDISDNFNFQCFSQLAAQNPRDHYIFIFDSPFDPAIIVHPNITAVLLGPQIRNSFLQRYWYDFKLPRVLNKYNATIFISSNTACSLYATAEQAIVFGDRLLLADQQGRIFKNQLRRFIKKADWIIVPSSYLKSRFETVYGDAGEKLLVLPGGISNDLVPFDQNKKEEIKKAISGAEFFVYPFMDQEAVDATVVLKAFSLFKKWQQSSMQLVVLLSTDQEKKFSKLLGNYKYKEHVKLVTEREKKLEVLGAAYAAIAFPSSSPGYRNEMLAAFRLKVPLILPDHSLYESHFGPAALYASHDEKSISDKMMLLYKDENLRNKLIRMGEQLAGTLDWQSIAGQLRQAIVPVSHP